MKNPLKSLREANELTLDQVAHLSGVTPHAVLKSEKGVYELPSQKLLDFFLDNDNQLFWTEAQIIHDYKSFRVFTRQSSGPYSQVSWTLSKPDSHSSQLIFPIELLPINPNKNPFTAYREYYVRSKSQVSNCLCLHPTIIHKLELQPEKYQTLPKQFLEATADAGYTMAWQAHLADWFNQYKQRLRENVKVEVNE